MADQALHPPEAGGQVRQPQLVDEAARELQISLDIEADHASEPLHLARRHGMVGMAGQAGVEHLADLGVPLEPAGDLEGGLVLSLHAQGQGLEAADQQVGGVRIGVGADDVAELLDRLHHRPLAADAAGHQVVVPPQVLGGAVEHEIGAELDGTLVHRRGEGAVDEQAQPVLSGEGHEPVEVGHVQVRVRRRFGEEDPGLLADRPFQGFEVARGDARAGDAELAEDIAELDRAPVAVLHDHQVLAAAHHGQQDRGDGAHAGGEQQGGVGPVEGGELGLGGADRGIAVAAVLEVGALALLVLLELVEAVEYVGRRLGDRRGHRLGVLAALLAAVDRPGGRAARGGGREIFFAHSDRFRRRRCPRFRERPAAPARGRRRLPRAGWHGSG